MNEFGNGQKGEHEESMIGGLHIKIHVEVCQPNKRGMGLSISCPTGECGFIRG
jgi:hypothetical protein